MPVHELLNTCRQINIVQVDAMNSALQKEIQSLTALATERGAVAKVIPAKDIVVSQWVRFKCRYGCKGYGKHFGCPPYAPSYEETKRMVSEFSLGILLRFNGVPGHEKFGPEDIPEDFHPFYTDLIRWVNGTVHFLEKTAFYDGFYKALGFGGYPCIWCEHQHCVAEEAEGIVDESLRRKCRHMDMVRPSMEAACMDVFATAKNAGWELKTIPCKNLEYGKIVHSEIVSIGLVLIE
jgi:predicted metal-binding protein